MIEKEAVFAHLYLSYECNLNCDYCSLPGLDKKLNADRDLTLDEWKTGLTALKQRVLSFNLYGLEPTLYPYIVELCEWMSKEKFSYVLNTNGVRAGVMEQLTKIPLAGIALSCDSLTGEYVDFSSKLKSQAFVNWRDRFDHVPVKIVGITVTRKNIFEVQRMVEVISEWGWLSCVNLLMEQTSDAQIAAAPKGLQDVAFRESDRTFVSNVGTYLAKNVEKLNLIYPPSYFNSWGKYMGGHSYRCNLNRTDVIAVSPDGYLWPCQEIPGEMAKHKSFPIRDMDDDEVWGRYKRARKEEIARSCKGTTNGCCYVAREVGLGVIDPKEVV